MVGTGTSIFVCKSRLKCKIIFQMRNINHKMVSADPPASAIPPGIPASPASVALLALLALAASAALPSVSVCLSSPACLSGPACLSDHACCTVYWPCLPQPQRANLLSPRRSSTDASTQSASLPASEFWAVFKCTGTYSGRRKYILRWKYIPPANLTIF